MEFDKKKLSEIRNTRHYLKVYKGIEVLLCKGSYGD